MITNPNLVIFADDDPDDREFFRFSLPENYKCLTMNDGSEFIDYLDDPASEIPFVVFLDINMPKMGGFECLIKIREKYNNHDLPVVMYSTSGNERDINYARQAGADMYIKKPTDVDSLKKIIERTLSCVNLEYTDLSTKSLIVFREE